MKRLGALLCTGMMVFASPAVAGFEFTPPNDQAPAQEIPAESLEPAMEAPMPIIPAEPVSAEPLPAPDTDPVLAQPVSRAPAPEAEPVYVRRQRDAMPARVMKSQPMEAEALLTATADKQPLVDDGKLVINPYPLEGDAIHGGDGGKSSVEQAMMEESGMLRPVKTPGSGRAGLVARTRPTAAQPLKKEEKDYGDEVLISSTSITPFPGNEPKMSDFEKTPVPEMPRPAPLLPEDRADAPVAPVEPATAAAPREPSAAPAGQYADAVGFGRDLPLALALSQVVPPEYSYAFARNVNVGTTVSWQGGKPWNQVLDDMLAQNGMKADIQDGQVVIHNAS